MASLDARVKALEKAIPPPDLINGGIALIERRAGVWWWDAARRILTEDEIRPLRGEGYHVILVDVGDNVPPDLNADQIIQLDEDAPEDWL